jgi:hypothetical protein
MATLINLDRALAEGRITLDEHARLRKLGADQTSELALNSLVGFGVVAVAVGFLALFPAALAAVAWGTLLGGGGLALRGRWRTLGNVLLVVGACLLAGGLVVLDDGAARAYLAAGALFAGAAILARNGLLASLCVLALASAVGARGGYAHATYMLGLERPGWTILLFSGLALALVAASARLPEALSRLAVIAARTSLLLVNLGFWIGSLWGDAFAGRDLYAALWALALAGTAAWAWRANRRWPLVTTAVFAGIHFFTQWFARLGADPAVVLIAGVLAIGAALGLKAALAAMPGREAA